MIQVDVTNTRVKLISDQLDGYNIMTLSETYSLIEKLKDAASQLEINLNHESRRDEWIPASGGKETPFKTRSGKVLLYCWNPHQERHAYLDVGADIILTDDEASDALMMR
jgi:hypothetical protein